jgi:membrane associated rhomboid family serine protease
MNLSYTLILIGITVLTSWLALNDRGLLDRLLLWPPAIARQGQWYRMVTHGFVHADFPHLLFNMITLYFFGSLVEQTYFADLGPLAYLAFYVGGLVVASLPSYIRHRNDAAYRSLGASGAVTAVLFGYILLAPWQMIFVFFLPVPAIIFAVLYVGYSIWAQRRGKDNIGHSAHLTGAAYGVIVCILIEPRVLPHFLAQLTNPQFNL